MNAAATRREPSRWRVQLCNFTVRQLLEEYKTIYGIGELIGLNDRQRADFEVWAITEGAKRGLDVFGNAEYRESIIKANAAIMKAREGKL